MHLQALKVKNSAEFEGREPKKCDFFNIKKGPQLKFDYPQTSIFASD